VDVPATVPKSLKDANNNAVCFTVMRSDLQNMLAAQLPPGAYPTPLPPAHSALVRGKRGSAKPICNVEPAAVQRCQKVANRDSKRFGTARQERALERWTTRKPQRRTCSRRYGVPPCGGKPAGVATRPRERSPTRKSRPKVTIFATFASLYAGTVKLGSEVVGVTEAPSGVRLQFADGGEQAHTAMKKLRTVILRFGTARQKMVLERWTNPTRLEVPNPNITIRNFFIAVGPALWRGPCPREHMPQWAREALTRVRRKRRIALTTPTANAVEPPTGGEGRAAAAMIGFDVASSFAVDSHHHIVLKCSSTLRLAPPSRARGKGGCDARAGVGPHAQPGGTSSYRER
jgi:hypothetical protein